MIIFGVDPGHNFTGVAYLQYHVFIPEKGPVIEKVEGVQLPHAISVRDWIRERRSFSQSGNLVVVEDYLSSGPLTETAKTTLQVLGYFRWAIPDMTNTQVFIQPPQERLCRVRQATELLEDAYPDLTKPELKDTVSALAHALAFVYNSNGL